MVTAKIQYPGWCQSNKGDVAEHAWKNGYKISFEDTN